MYELGEKLRNLRKKKKLSQAQVAKKLNLSASSVSSYENFTKSPGLDVLVQLALFYNVSADYLLGIDHREFINVDKLSTNQKKLVESLVDEFSSQSNNSK